MTPQPTASGIVTDERSGERHIPESKRADGSVRKAIKVRPGYRPPEDVEVYKNPTAENFRNRGKGPVPGAEGLKSDKPAKASPGAVNKNAKRREARKKAKAAGDVQSEEAPAEEVKKEELDPEAEKEKKARTLKKKLRQAKELKEKKEGGQALLPEQISKVIRINELIRELDALGFDAEGEPKTATVTTKTSAE
jgi:partner of Y14 and mago protein